AQVAPEEKLLQLLRGLGEIVQLGEPGAAPLGVAGTEGGRDQRLEQAGLAVGGRAEGAEVAGRDPVAGEIAAGRRDVGVALEVEDLRDRNVRELGLQPVADRADRQALLPGGCFGGAHARWRKLRRYLPIWSSSPSSSSADSTRLRLTKVPFRLPWSSIT